MLLSNDRVPFAAALSPWLADGVRRLERLTPSLGRTLNEAAVNGLAAGLEADLGFVLAPSLLAAFRRHPARRRATHRSTDDYVAFGQWLAEGGLETVMGQHGALPALVESRIDDWCRRVDELVVRLERDGPILGQRFGLQFPLSSARMLLRTVVELVDSHGASVIYKARSLSMDSAFAEVLDWVNRQSPDYSLHVVDVVDLRTYGWMSRLPHDPIEEDDWYSFLVRSGMLLCLTHLLGGGDLHAANIRFRGGEPVVIDSEVLLRPRRAGNHPGGADGPSVLSTGWLPVPGEIERCGLAAGHFEGRTEPWVHLGTDGVRPRPQGQIRSRKRLQVIEDWRNRPKEIIAGLSDGFATMYDLVGSVAPSSPSFLLDLLAEAEPRVLMRTSLRYADAIDRSVTVPHVESMGAHLRSFGFVDEEPPPTLADHPAVATAAARAERLAMGRFEIPRFHVEATGHTLWAGDEPIGRVFNESPLQRARRFIGAMSDEAEAAQLRAIADSINGAVSGSFDLSGTIIESGVDIRGACRSSASPDG